MSHPYSYYLKVTGFKLNTRSIFLFFVLCIASWLLNIVAQIIFPAQSSMQYFTRLAAVAIGVLILIGGSNKLLAKNNLPADAMGLKLSAKSFYNFILGAAIGATALILMGLILYIFVPYHFETGTLKGIGAIKEAHVYFWGNFLEELTFRGYPLIILSQLFGWRKAAWMMALPFGLFHLPGLGFNIQGLTMIVTTAAYSLVFSYAFILTGSLWTATGVHVVSNIILHSIIGLDGLKRAMFIPVFDRKWPVGYDPGLLSFLISLTIISFTLSLLIKRRFKDLLPKLV